jgi:hypothetical protein
MDDPRAVRGGKSLGEVGRDGEQLVDRQWSGHQQVSQPPAVYQVHDQVWPAVGQPGLVYSRDPGMVDAGEHGGLAVEGALAFLAAGPRE